MAFLFFLFSWIDEEEIIDAKLIVRTASSLYKPFNISTM